ncbi:PKD domain-containing protein [Massilia glaciei]|nr:PKD domain-containing protein [Massilia glaciei]
MECATEKKRKKRLFGWSIPRVAGAGLAAAAVTAGAAAPAPAPPAGAGLDHTCGCVPTYHIVNLGSGQLPTIPQINARGQVAFSLFSPTPRAYFYDGAMVRNIGDLGAPEAYAEDLNEWGQVTGYAAYGNGLNVHAFVWSAAAGMVDLRTLGNAVYSQGRAINNLGQVAGYSQWIGPALDPYHAFRWSFASGMMDLGTVAGLGSVGTVINDAGMVVGFSNAASGNAHAFAWRHGTGMVDLGALGGDNSYAEDVNESGQVAGSALVSMIDFNYHAVFWNSAGAMFDLGTLGGPGSGVWDMNNLGQVVGVADTAAGKQHAMSWTMAGGMRDLGTLGGSYSSAIAVNDKGQVVGAARTRSDRSRAFLWSAGRPMADLNRRIKNAPAGLRLEIGVAINDKGWIVAESNAGLVLLKPGPGALVAPAIGPIAVRDSVPPGRPVMLSAGFSDADLADTHSAVWSWGDGSADAAGTVIGRAGAGRAAGSHTFDAPGVYWVTLTLTDNTGRTSAVSRKVVVAAPCGCVAAANGWFMSPAGALKSGPPKAALASFSFDPAGTQTMAKGGAQAKLRFSAGNMHFQSDSYQQIATAGGRGQYRGGGTLNGVAGYSFALTMIDGAAAGGGHDRFGLRITHVDPATKAEVVDYDNGAHGSGALARGMPAGVAGSAISGGRIVIR